MKRKFKITFEVDCDYPYLKKETKTLTKAFDRWLKEWSSRDSSGQDIIPVLYTEFEPDEHQANGTVRVKITRDKEVILDKSWNELAPTFKL